MNNAQSFKTTVDVRNIVPRERHPLIFGSFDQLAGGVPSFRQVSAAARTEKRRP